MVWLLVQGFWRLRSINQQMLLQAVREKNSKQKVTNEKLIDHKS